MLQMNPPLICNQQSFQKKEIPHKQKRKSLFIFLPTLVFAGGRPSSYFLFFLIAVFLPPVFRLLCQESREIPKTERQGYSINAIIHFQATRYCYNDLKYHNFQGNAS